VLFLLLAEGNFYFSVEVFSIIRVGGEKAEILGELVLVGLGNHKVGTGDVNAIYGEVAASERLQMARAGYVRPWMLGVFFDYFRGEVFTVFGFRHVLLLFIYLT
jgi:hypothetical protein